MSKPKIPVTWAPDELKFIKENYHTTSLSSLLYQINENRIGTVDSGALRHQCRRMNLKKCLIIHWHKADIQYLVDNYKTKGNKEIAIDLNDLKRTFRIIDGNTVYRKFNKKAVEKKLKLLKLKRSAEEIFAIWKRNIEKGLTVCIRHDDNYWTKGIRKKAAEEEIRIWPDQSGRMRRFIKINGHFIPYTRWFYHNFICPIPARYIVAHKDFDSLNDDPENLVVRKRKRLSREEFNRGLQLLNTREKNVIRKIRASKTRVEERELMSELSRIRNIEKYIRRKLTKDNERYCSETVIYDFRIHN